MNLRGVYCILMTPLHEDETVDVPALQAQVNRVLAAGAHGVVALGSNGEGPLLAESEWERTVATVAEAVNKRVPVVAGTTAPGTRLALRNTRRARELGADLCILMPPFYIPLDQPGTIRHYETVAEDGALPIILYNYPGVSKVELSVDTVAHLSRHPNVAGIKDSSGNFPYHLRLLALHRPDFAVFQSWDDLGPSAVAAGSAGIMSPTCSLIPKLCVAQWQAMERGETEAVRRLNAQIVAFTQLASSAPWPAGWKAMLQLMGIGNGRPAAPALPVSGEKLEQFRTRLTEWGLI